MTYYALYGHSAVSSNLRNGEIDALSHIAKVLYTGTGKELWPFL